MTEEEGQHSSVGLISYLKPKMKIFKTLFLFTLVFLGPTHLNAQNKPEIGFFGGVSYYMGDINPQQVFYSPGPAVGGLFRYLINPRYAVRLQLNYGQLSGSDLDFSDNFRQQRGAAFNNSLVESIIVGEINFLEFLPKTNARDFTPFISGGIGYAFLVNSSVPSKNHLTIPFSVGAKTSINQSWSVSVEWSFRKTFFDKLDGLANPGNDIYQSSFHNNDWYYFAGVALSYRLFNDAGNCPVYQ